ncbi:pentraxin-related protein PTX3-like [Erpetoichthys calabaricus]|uniref:Pentraxin-related protein PTX3 n=1 Tax=Erpetoichthys calabaricus TaxID=27687 RepID=A0A8C4SJ26_ERPCA|nr:pentraxin-related protein PTX3-like [Erpetoichthys calabaricus]
MKIIMWKLLRAALLCYFFGISVLVSQYDHEFEVQYQNGFENEIKEEEEEATPTPCESPELGRWDKLFAMLENSQMKENMLLQYVDDILKVEVQSLRTEMLQFVANFAGTCTNAVDSAKTRIISQLDRKLMEITDRIKGTDNTCQSENEERLEQLLASGQDIINKLSKIENAWQNTAEANGSDSEVKLQDGSVCMGLEKVIDSLTSNLQQTQKKIELTQMWASQRFLPAGCEMALLFPMRSKKIFASVSPVAAMTLNAFTACIWAKVTEALNKTVLFSYGTKRNPYEIQLSLRQQSVILTVGSEEHSVVAENAVSAGQWAHICGTWNSEEGKSSVWVNGELMTTALGVAESHTIPDGGILQLGQEKNGCCVGGGFDENLAFSGKLTGFNLWNRTLNGTQIIYLATSEDSCDVRGNVIGWGVTEIIPQGGAQYIH